MSELKSMASGPEIIAALARQIRAGVDKVPSPCISVCRMTITTGLCEGCFRTIDEIRLWSQSDDAAKRAMWVKIEQRAAQSLS
jgi:predicted Fe-S protein YdhL (DUF1289 family)